MDAQDLEQLRRYLFAIAYRMLGSASDAEDIVQEAYLRWQGADQATVRAPRAYLSAVVTRLCLDELKSARVTREAYHGPWLPEPVPSAELLLLDDRELTPQERVERQEDVSLAFLTLLERLTPEERAAYVLREAFDYDHAEIADVLGKSVPAVRQLAHRARQRVGASQTRFQASLEEQRKLTERFLAAAWQGDLRGLTELLAADVVSWSDGGAETLAARRAILGSDAVARRMIGLALKVYADVATTYEPLNGGMGVLFWRGEQLLNATVATVADGRIQAVHSVLNPHKLAYLRARVRPPTSPQ
jgi:RNA polymerase sigma-70 factor (ECF subfamily)